MKHWQCIGLFCLLTPVTTTAQKVMELAPFDVIDSNVNVLNASFSQTFDSIQNPQPTPDVNLVDFLERRSAMNFKNNGPGLLSTPTFRGGDANHTQVLWNGMRINSPMLGTIDFSTLPYRQFSSINVITANSSNLYSSGGMGGAVSLIQRPNFVKQDGEVGYWVSSFGNAGNYARFNVPFKLWKRPAVAGVSTDQIQANNQFPYLDISEEPYEEKIRENAAFQRSNTSAYLAIKPSEQTQLSAFYWLGRTDRNIPAPINSVQSTAQQQDIAHRGMISGEWKNESQLRIGFRTMYEHNQNRYEDSLIDVKNNNQYQSIQNQLELDYMPLQNLKISARGNFTFIKAESKNYTEHKSATGKTGLLVAKYRFWKKRIHLEGGYRYEDYLSDHAFLPFAGLDVKPVLTLPLHFLISASNTVRFPTLNERFWKPGGNPNLNPETGSSIESGLKWEGSQLEMQVVGFYGEYQNRIRWLPTGALFSPTNVDYSEVRGVSSTLNLDQRFSKHDFHISANASYLHARGSNDDGALHQLSYIPEWSGNLNLDYTYQGIQCYYGISYTGQRFITNDESAYLPHYIIQRAGMAYQFKAHQRFVWIMGLSVDNIADWQYHNMPWRPMPGRSINAKITVRWN